jgi:pimeloyl-ACP methyl ester carboxylesterase
VHGGVVGGQAFANWIEPLVEEGYRVVVPDLLGYGYSARPDVPYTREFYLGQLRSLIDELGIREPVHLAGGSFGGIEVAEFAAENPGEMASVALMSPAGLGKSDVVNPLLLTPLIGDWVFRVLGADLVTRQMATADAGSPGQHAMLDWMTEQSKYRGFADGMLNSLRHYDFQWRPQVFQALGRSGVPVFAAWGTEETVHPYERTKLLQRYAPQTELLTLGGVGHAITYGRAEHVLDGYSRFLLESAR